MRPLLIAAILLTSAAPWVPAGQTSPWLGDWVADVPNVGKVALSLSEVRENRYGKLFWLFETLDIKWEAQNDTLFLSESAGYGLPGPDAQPVMMLNRLADGHLAFEAFGLITQKRFQALAPIVFKHGGNLQELAAFARHGSEYDKFHIQGQLQPLPAGIPGELMDVTTLLFRFRDHELWALLKHPSLSSEVLSQVTSDVLDPNAKNAGALHSLPPILAAHPHLAKTDLERLFEIPDKYEMMSPIVWRAAAMNPSAPVSFSQVYLERIKNGDFRTRVWVARDTEAPREAWELALANDEGEVLEAFAQNAKAPPDLLSGVAAKHPRSPAVARNDSTPVRILEEMSQSTDKQVLWASLDNKNAPSNAVSRALRTLATSRSAGERHTAARDARLDRELAFALMRDPNITVRHLLARNSVTPFEVLTNLANDPYRLVSEPARRSLEDRFHGNLWEIKGHWRPLEQLSPYQFLSEDFADAVRRSDVARAERVLGSTQDPETKVELGLAINLMLETNFEAFTPLLLETIKQNGQTARDAMLGSGHLRPENVAWLEVQRLFPLQSAESLLISSSERGKAGLVGAVLKSGVGNQLSADSKAKALFKATAARSLDCLDLLIRSGANPDLNIEEILTPLGGTNRNAMVKQSISSVDLAAKTYFIAGLRRLDRDGKYRPLLAEFDKEFPAKESSYFLGTWDNSRDGFSQVRFTLTPDATGFMAYSIMGGPIVWRQLSASQVQLYLVDANGIRRDEPISMDYNPDQHKLIWEKKGEDGRFERVSNN